MEYDLGMPDICRCGLGALPGGWVPSKKADMEIEGAISLPHIPPAAVEEPGLFNTLLFAVGGEAEEFARFDLVCSPASFTMAFSDSTVDRKVRKHLCIKDVVCSREIGLSRVSQYHEHVMLAGTCSEKG